MRTFINPGAKHQNVEPSSFSDLLTYAVNVIGACQIRDQTLRLVSILQSQAYFGQPGRTAADQENPRPGAE